MIFPPRPSLGLAVLLGGFLVACGSAPDGGVPQPPSDGPDFARSPGWSIQRRMRSPSGNDVVLEEQPTTFAVLAWPGRIRRVDAPGTPTWDAPAGLSIEDAALHPSGAVSAVLVDAAFAVWLARLSPELALLQLKRLDDPDIAGDPFPPGPTPAPTTLAAHSLPRDAVRVAADGEEAVVLVTTQYESVILYRLAFSGQWQPPRRALVHPVDPHTPFLPIGGSFDTFKAMWSSFRALLDVDAAGNVYVAFWASPRKIQRHADFTGEALHPVVPSGSFSPDSDVLLEKRDRSFVRLWSRVVGTENEDEPYAMRATTAGVAVVGRSRRVPGDDNTFWDALLSVSDAEGTLRASRTFQLDASSILLAVDGRSDGSWVVGGSDGWSQNPGGLSILSFGTKLLLELPGPSADAVRHPLPVGPRHNEIRSVLAGTGRTWFAGHEDGPIMHTGDGDLTQIHATGVLGVLAR